jgi:hypothetical protein
MDNLKKFIIKRKYDLLAVVSIILMISINVIFAVPAIIFLIIGESKTKH